MGSEDAPKSAQSIAPPFSLRPIFIPAFGPSIFFGLAEGAVLPVIALTARHLGATLATTSLVVALMGVGSLLSNIPSALISQRFGERKAIIGASGVSMLAMVLCFTAHSVAWLAVAMLFIGLADSIFTLARQSYLTQVVPVRMRARALSTLGGTSRIGLFIGPFIGAAAISGFGLRAAYVVGFCAAASAGLIGLRYPDLVEDRPSAAEEPERPTIRGVLASHQRVFLTLGIGVILISAVRSSRQVVVPLWAEHLGLGASTTSLIYGIAGAVDMCVFYPAGKVMDHYGRRWVAVPSMLLMGAALVGMAFSTGFGSLLLAAMVLGFGNGIGSGMVMTLGADVSPTVGRPAFLGIWRELSDIGGLGGPLLLSGITAVATLAAGVLANGGIGFAAAAILWYWIPRTRRPAESRVSPPSGPP
ncbi:MAG: napC [Frankiales bacterium]|nr:napC [Frankiales bacterium]